MSTAEEAPNLPVKTVERLSGEAVSKAKVKEKERVSKWERMLRVGERDGGMNVSRWTWEQDRKGQKVSSHCMQDPDKVQSLNNMYFALHADIAARTSVQGSAGSLESGSVGSHG
jgi:hypothetical protein